MIFKGSYVFAKAEPDICISDPARIVFDKDKDKNLEKQTIFQKNYFQTLLN